MTKTLEGDEQDAQDENTLKTDISHAGAQIARAAGIVMGAYIVSNLIGVLRGMVVSNAFGTSADLDAFNAANRISELLFNLLAGGALGSAFIPMFTGYLTRNDRKGAWRLLSGVFNTLVIVLLLVSGLVWLFAPSLVRNGLFGLVQEANPGQVQVTVRLLRIMLPTVLIFGISGLLMGILNAHGVFLWPALAPAMYSLGIIVGVYLPASWGIDRLAIGVVLGALGHLALQIPALWKLKDKAYDRLAGIRDDAVRTVMKLMLPRMIGAGVVQLNFVANTVIALSLGEGAASSLALAFTLMLMPQAAIAQSAGTAALPTLSAQVELGQMEAYKQTLMRIIRVILLLSVPAAVGMILLRTPLITLLYQRGQFTEHSTQMVAWALLWYCVGLPGHSLLELLSRAFYALRDTRTPVSIGVLAMALNIGLSFVFSRFFMSLGWMGHGGLAAANSLATFLECLVLLLILRRRLGGLDDKAFLSALGTSLLGSVLMLALILPFMALFEARGSLFRLVGGLVLGVGSYAGVLLLLCVPELTGIWHKFSALLVRLKARK